MKKYKFVTINQENILNFIKINVMINNKSCLKDLKRGVKLKPSQLNHRLFNCLLYLNDNFEGGETEFPELKKKYKLPIGNGILWSMTNIKGDQVHPLAGTWWTSN